MDKIINILEKVLESDAFKQSEDFVEDDIIDSLDIITLTQALEEAFDIRLEGKDIIPENFKNIDAIMKLVERLSKR